MVIVDASVWIDFLTGRRNPESLWVHRELSNERLAITDLILCEVLRGIRDDAIFSQTRLRLTSLTTFHAVGAKIALASAVNYRKLRALGVTVRKTVDCLTATFCIEHGHSLLHRDRDFDPFEEHLGLKVIHP